MGFYRTGRLKGTRSTVFKTYEEYSLGTLPTPPPTWEVPYQHENVNSWYPIDCNQRIGNCTIAGVDHLARASVKLYGGKYSYPTEPLIEKTYFGFTKGQDTGLNEEFVMKEWVGPGIFGSKAKVFAPVSRSSLLQWHQAISMTGALYLGIACPESAQRAFQKEQETGNLVPWVYEGEQTEDGHCVVALGYGPNGGLHCATWGGIAVLTPSFLAHYLEEAWVVVTEELAEAKKDTLGLDLEAIEADIAKI